MLSPGKQTHIDLRHAVGHPSDKTQSSNPATGEQSTSWSHQSGLDSGDANAAAHQTSASATSDLQTQSDASRQVASQWVQIPYPLSSFYPSAVSGTTMPVKTDANTVSNSDSNNVKSEPAHSVYAAAGGWAGFV